MRWGDCEESHWCVPKGVRGPDIALFSDGLSKAPVTWNYSGPGVTEPTEIKLEFKSGFMGATQDE